jgi:hypothetical protein
MENVNVPTVSKIGNPVQLTGKAINPGGVLNGELDCDDFTATALPTGSGSAAQAEAIIIYEQTATNDASRFPLLFIDGLTVIPNGGNYLFQVQSSSPFLGRV